MSDFAKRKKAKEHQHQVKKDDVTLDSLVLDRENPRQHEDRVLYLDPTDCYVTDQVRKDISESEIDEREASLRANGQIQPIIVHPPDDNGKYLIDKGECRWRAASRIEGFKLKAIVDYEASSRTDEQRIIGQLVENEQRANLQPIEVAEALSELLKAGMTQEEVAREVGWVTGAGKPNINKVSRTAGLLKLPEDGKALAREGVLSDVLSLETLRKVHDVDHAAYEELVAKARGEGGLSRQEIDERYQRERERAKGGDSGKSKAPKTKAKNDTPSKPSKQEHALHVRVASTGEDGVVDLKKSTPGDSSVYVRIAGEPREVPLHELEILGVVNSSES